ncbi:hypothetical protein [Paraburkholderia youngii]|uniref:hypothetical protein n=1 Tax=Paraburkholderia youngii TaxID=2782701 RepID=UPI0034A5A0D2
MSDVFHDAAGAYAGSDAGNELDGKAHRPSQRIPGLCPVCRSAPGPRRHHRDRGAGERPTAAGRAPIHDLYRRAVEKDETEGLMKVIVDAETSRILGAAILGTGGDEAIQGLLDLMSAGIPTQPSRTQSRSTRPYRSSSRLCSER